MPPFRIFTNETLNVAGHWEAIGAPTFHECLREPAESHDGDSSIIKFTPDFDFGEGQIQFGFDDVPAGFPDILGTGSPLLYVTAKVTARSTFSPAGLRPEGWMGIFPPPSPSDIPEGSVHYMGRISADRWVTYEHGFGYDNLTVSTLNQLRLAIAIKAGEFPGINPVRITSVVLEFFNPFVGHTTNLRWGWRDPVMRVPRFRWTIRPGAARTSHLRWNIKGVPAKRSRFRWRVLTTVGRSSKLRWGVRASVGKSSQFRWKVEPPSFKVTRFRWDLGGTTAKTSRVRWRVSTVSEAKVSKLRWKILTAAWKRPKFRWDVWARAAGKARLRWMVANPFSLIDDVRILDTVCDDQPDKICHPYVTLEVLGRNIYQVRIKSGDLGYGDWMDYGEGLFELTLEPGEGDKTICARARNLDLVETPEQCTTITLEVGDQLRQLQDNLPAIYSTKKSGLLYEILSAWALWLCHASRSIDSAIDQGNVNLAIGTWLDQWGWITGIGRKIGERDAPYRARLATWLTTDKVTLAGLHTLAGTEVGTGELRFRELTQFPCYIVGDLTAAGDYDFDRIKQAIDLVKPAGVKVIWHGGDWTIEIIPIDDDIIGPNDEARYTVRVHSTGGFTGSVTLSIGNLLAGYTASFSNNPVLVPPNGSVDSLLIIQPTSAQPGFTIEVIPEFIELAGPSGTFTVRVCSVGGFSGLVALSTAMVPAGFSGSFNPQVVNVPMGACVDSVLTLQRL